MRLWVGIPVFLAGLAAFADARTSFGPDLQQRATMQLSAVGDVWPIGLVLIVAALAAGGIMLVAGALGQTWTRGVVLGMAAMAAAVIAASALTSELVPSLAGQWLSLG